MTLLHVPSYSGHIQGDGYQRKEKSWLMILEV